VFSCCCGSCCCCSIGFHLGLPWIRISYKYTKGHSFDYTKKATQQELCIVVVISIVAVVVAVVVVVVVYG